MIRRSLLSICLCCAGLCASVASAEELITVTTYYPSPQGVYKSLRAKRLAVGNNYFQQKWADEGGGIPNDVNLTVEGNVGIGNLTPTYRLHVTSPELASSVGSFSLAQTITTDLGADDQELQLFTYRNATGSDWKTADLYLRRKVNFTPMGFIKWTGDCQGIEMGTNTQTYFTMTSDGNIGIGTTLPNYKMHIISNPLGTNVGDRSLGQTIYTDVGANNQELQIFTQRSAAGSDWNTADIYMRRRIDSTDMGFIKWPGGAGNYGIEFGNSTSTTMRIDDNGKVGIGTVAPDASLSIYDATAARMNIQTAASNRWWIEAGNAVQELRIGGNGGTAPSFYPLRIKPSGQGTVSITAQDGSCKTDWPGTWGGGLQTWDITCSGLYYSTQTVRSSDIRLKEDVVSLDESVLDKIMRIRPVTFHWKEKTHGNGLQYGFIAQEVEKIAPELVMEDASPMKKKALSEDGIFVMLVKAVQQIKQLHDQDVEALRKENKALTERLEKLEKRVAEK